MTPRKAAAICREWAKRESQHNPQMAAAFHAAAYLIDEINQPQPWPPPKDVRKCLAYIREPGRWVGTVAYEGEDWNTISYHEGPYTHYLPMPPAPETEVQG